MVARLLAGELADRGPRTAARRRSRGEVVSSPRIGLAAAKAAWPPAPRSSLLYRSVHCTRDAEDNAGGKTNRRLPDVGRNAARGAARGARRRRTRESANAGIPPPSGSPERRWRRTEQPAPPRSTGCSAATAKPSGDHDGTEVERIARVGIGAGGGEFGILADVAGGDGANGHSDQRDTAARSRWKSTSVAPARNRARRRRSPRGTRMRRATRDQRHRPRLAGWPADDARRRSPRRR